METVLSSKTKTVVISPNRPFVIIGANSIVAYVSWHLFDFGLVADVFIAALQPMVGDWWPFLRNVGATVVLF